MWKHGSSGTPFGYKTSFNLYLALNYTIYKLTFIELKKFTNSPSKMKRLPLVSL